MIKVQKSLQQHVNKKYINKYMCCFLKEDYTHVAGFTKTKKPFLVLRTPVNLSLSGHLLRLSSHAFL
ncbi:hypothetical protein N665_0165s0007 [Sinapis alba]|nr:hypothetical protein N665_0165s0007 [Sinapis alba]